MLALALTALLTAQADPSEHARRLIEQLRSDKAPQREDARRQLKELGRKAAPELEKASRDRDPEVVNSVLPLLRALSIVDLLPPSLRKALPGLEFRLAEDKHAWTTVFLELTKDLPEAVEREDLEVLAAPALRGAGNAAEKDELLDELAATRFRSAAPEVLRLLGEWKHRQAAAWVLASWDIKEAVPTLIEMLDDPDADVIVRALACLQRLDARESAPAVRKCLKHADERVLGTAALTLGCLGDRESAPPIVRLLRHEQPWVRAEAARALGFLGIASTAVDLLPLLGDKDPGVRASAAMALGGVKVRSVHPALIPCLKDENRSVRSAASSSLALLGVQAAIPDLATLLQDPELDVRRSALGALEMLKAVSAIPRITPLLKHEDGGLRLQAARCLCRMGSREGVPTVLAEGTFAILNMLRAPARTRALEDHAIPGALEGTVADLVRRLTAETKGTVELPEMDAAAGAAKIYLPPDGGVVTLLDAWERLAQQLPGRCEVIVDEDRIRIVTRERALEFWTAWSK